MESFISPKTKKGEPSNIHGKGFFAIDHISKGEVVAIKRGILLSSSEMEKRGLFGRIGLQVGDDEFIAPATKEDFEKSMIYINYSCNPNIGMQGFDTVVAFRDIEKGEELVMDYAMIANDDTSIECACGSVDCRHVVTGKDWMKPDLQKKYKGYFTEYIQSKIDNIKN